MSFLDRIRSWFKGETKKRRPPGPSTAGPSGQATKDLEAFLETRDGVEGFLEPKTAIYSTTLLLVAADGEYIRRPIRDRGHAESVCDKFNTPLYDAAIVGYPKRMRDYDQGIRRQTVSLDDLPPWPGPDDGPGDGAPGRDDAGPDPDDR